MNWQVKWVRFWETMSNPYWTGLFFKGLLNTVLIAVCGLLIGIVVGTLIAMVKVAPKYKRVVRVLDKICSVYVAIFRGTPMVVQLLITYYVLLPAIGAKGVEAINVGIVVFGLNSGAYVSEIMRGGINSVDRGQLDAGRALGLTYGTSMIKIVIPQAVKNILPALGNEFVTMIKETSIIQYLGVGDLMYNNGIVITATYNPLPCYYISAIIYLTLNIVLGKGLDLFERRMKCSDR